MNSKKIILSVLVLSMALFGLTCCNKKKDDTSGGTGKSFYVKLDGTAFEPAGGGRYYSISSGGFQIVGDDANTTIELVVSSVAVGTYSLGGAGTTNSASVFYTAGSKVYVSTSGEVKITKSAGDKISGTFKYTAVGTSGTVQVTAGEFNDIAKKP